MRGRAIRRGRSGTWRKSKERQRITTQSTKKTRTTIPERAAHTGGTRRTVSGEGAFGKVGEVVLSQGRICSWGTMAVMCLTGNSNSLYQSDVMTYDTAGISWPDSLPDFHHVSERHRFGSGWRKLLSAVAGNDRLLPEREFYSLQAHSSVKD